MGTNIGHLNKATSGPLWLYWATLIAILIGPDNACVVLVDIYDYDNRAKETAGE